MAATFMLNRVSGGIILIIDMIVDSSDSILGKAIPKIKPKAKKAHPNEHEKMIVKFCFTFSPISLMFSLKFSPVSLSR